MSKKNQTATLFGKEDITVTCRDGRTETVSIKQIPIREVGKFLELLDDEPSLVEFLCGKEKGWADGLSIESYEEVAERGTALNYPTCAGFLARREKLAAWGAKEVMPRAQRIKELGSPNSAPTPPSPSGSPSGKSSG